MRQKTALGRLAVLMLGLFVLSPAPSVAAPESATGQAAVQPGAPFGFKLTIDHSVIPNATGLSLAGAKAYFVPDEQFRISEKVGGRPPGEFNVGLPPGGGLGGGPTEVGKMQSVFPLIEALVPLAVPPATNLQKLNVTTDFANGALSKFKETRPVGDAKVGDFTRIGKGMLTSTQAKATYPFNQPDSMIERAVAAASQKVVNVSGINTVDFTGTSVVARVTLPNDPIAVPRAPKASAYAVNIDPVAVDWSSAGSRTVTLDLTGIDVQAKTTGQGSRAAATDVFTGAVRDGETDVTLAEDGATQLFMLSLGVFDADDAPATAVVGFNFLPLLAANDPSRLLVGDSEGGSGLAGVLADLIASFTSKGDGIYQIVNIADPSKPFTITMTLPGSAPSSVLYFDEFQGAGAEAVPEGSTPALFAVGLLAMGMSRARGRKWPHPRQPRTRVRAFVSSLPAER